jgi:hypothetical protein
MVRNNEVAGAVQGIDIEDWNLKLVEMFKTKFAPVLARRMIKDSVMASNKLLDLIGKAVDGGIDVRIRSLAVKSRTNTSNYETGNLLRILGVDSDDVKGWKTRYLLPKASRH